MIVGFSTIEDIGAGFRSKLMMPRWKAAQQLLGSIIYDRFASLRVRIVIGQVERNHVVQGFEDGAKLVVEARIPIAEFKQFSIGEKNDLVLDTIFESIKAAYAHFGDVPPPEIDRIRHETRAVGK